MQHYYDCIVRAQDEVILATNYWQPSNSVDKIANALRELSKRHGKRRAFDSTLEPLVVKIMWDRGQLSQAIDNHAMVDQAGREALKLPKLAEIPHLTLEVINFHRPIMVSRYAGLGAIAGVCIPQRLPYSHAFSSYNFPSPFLPSYLLRSSSFGLSRAPFMPSSSSSTEKLRYSTATTSKIGPTSR